jgi:hypothetical protein
MKKKVIAVGGSILFLLLIIGFFLFFIHPSKPVEQPESTNVVITMQRTGCFGTCPSYIVAIYGEGRVWYSGQNYVAVTGDQTRQIPQEKVWDLVGEFLKISFANLEGEYRALGPDAPTITITITIGGSFYEVIEHGTAPQEIKDLERKIDEIAGTDVWVHGP